jgi:hypothetical protein
VLPSVSMFPSFKDALHADRPAADRAAKMALYGQFIGDWQMDANIPNPGGSATRLSGEIHFGWVLAGRAIQDVWILPGRFHGSTLRVYDPAIDAWHIVWSDPVRQLYLHQIGRAQGNDIVQQGKADNGDLTRWRFTEIMPKSFHWIGERSADDGADWSLDIEMFARRT